MNAIGVLVLDDDGKIKTHKLGRRSTAKGTGIGLVLAIIAPVSLVGGVIGGGVLGALHHKGLGIESKERDRIAAELSDGKAAVGVLAAEIAAVVSGKLAELGGAAEVLTVSEEAAAEADQGLRPWKRPRPPHPRPERASRGAGHGRLRTPGRRTRQRDCLIEGGR